MKKKVMLVVRDGWGKREEVKYNAVRQAKTPNITSYLENYPSTFLEAAGVMVGLPAGYMGSSEVGHLNMGAGRIVVQELKRLKDTIEDGSLFNAKPFKACIDNAAQNNSALHLMGLVQDEGVHAHQDHLFAIIEHAAKKGVKTIYVHFFADGRDTPPRSSIGFVRELEAKIKEYGAGQIATVMGRYYAMDRSEDWNLTDKAYALITEGKAVRSAKSAEEAVQISYDTDKTPDGTEMTDEYVAPAVINGYKGAKDGDSVIFFNFRQDRAIQLTRAFIDADYPGKREKFVKVVFCGLTKYYDAFEFNALPSMTDGGSMNNLLGQVLADNGKTQLRIAETQKFKHVTSFFNGKLIKPFKGEDRIELKGRFDPATFAEHPEMEAYLVADETVKQINSDKYDFILVNFANCDMVGHTGNMKSVIKAVEVVDECTGKITKAALDKGYTVLITADHGNAETMWDVKTNMPKTAHTCSLVELIYVSKDAENIKLEELGCLGDIAPTILDILGVEQPKDMDRKSLVSK
ncbi:Phosphoglycerate mutase, 2,3-bisphosphoglycerate-independent [Elusimicrobium minutum Pei191]|uniref:2,3-bisphosphoglycerate-independent phosphoglycerate mutase n=1 Tax=Elusimicrobium minutum (strain Pei191) TaxID=445932 RepID=B2KEE4_ELUMP|nr:2,3-bisphosphoglycerate-independent phosphoglycerate mutase [Elusimicrobium minutum]ACC98890.1 Phosphoglycerate mutase, 2,3-bisphosphoglycerate-independent [Elusimicrobium minutum Pei191]